MRADPDHIPHLLALLDDPDPEVSQQVYQGLMAYGHQLEHLLTPYLEEISTATQNRLFSWTKAIRHELFEAHWLEWLEVDRPYQAIEDALGWLGYLDSEWASPLLGDVIDQLSRRYQEQYASSDVSNLMSFLFIKEGFMPPEKDYYHPRHSNLLTVVHRRRGLQISLGILAMLVGSRLGLKIEGFNMPGHFMVTTQAQGLRMIYDPFNQGQALPESAYAFLEQSLLLKQTSMVELRAKPHQIILRVLSNLINAHEHQQESERAKFFVQRKQEVISLLKQSQGGGESF
ncbi:MAG: transglutaminase family protein [Bacteroidota bacterium]